MKQLIFIFIVLIAVSARAQKPEFAQTLLMPTHHFSALAGYHGAVQTNLQYRNQWPGIPFNYVTYALNVDGYIPGIKSGLGVIAMHDRDVSGLVQTNQVILNYSKWFEVNENLKIISGLTGSFQQVAIDWSQLTFPPHPTPIPLPYQSTPIEAPANGYMLGASAGIINGHRLLVYQFAYSSKPDFYEGADPVVFAYHDLYLSQRLFVEYKFNLIPSVNYRKYGEFNSITFAMNGQIGGFNLGLAYRWQDAILTQLGFEFNKRFLISYSYDVTVSPLSTQTLGSHELGIRLSLNTKNKKDVLIENLQLL